jgi:cyanate lyase
MLQTQVNQKARTELAERAVAIKLRKNLSFEQIAEGTGLNVVFVTAAILGQHPLPQEAAAKVGEHLGLDQSDIALLQAMPVRGSVGASIPTDPTMYRFYEITQVYGSTLKALVHENFGDGILSAINFRMSIEKVEDPDGGHRAVITLNSKYLPTKPW